MDLNTSINSTSSGNTSSDQHGSAVHCSLFALSFPSSFCLLTQLLIGFIGLLYRFLTVMIHLIGLKYRSSFLL
jgi:hypothetical protein